MECSGWCVSRHRRRQRLPYRRQRHVQPVLPRERRPDAHLRQISQDVVQEFQVLSSGYSAEYGRASGGIINTVTRGECSNATRDCILVLPNQALNARDRSARSIRKEKRYQAGASLGGPIVQDRCSTSSTRKFTAATFPWLRRSRGPRCSTRMAASGTCDGQRASQCAAARAFLRPSFSGARPDGQFGARFWQARLEPSERTISAPASTICAGFRPTDSRPRPCSITAKA